MSRGQNDRDLSNEAKIAINGYLFRLAGWFGFGNLIIVAGAFLYIYFLLPHDAAELAQKQLIPAITNLEQTANELFYRAGEQKSRLDNLKAEIQNVETQLPILKGGLHIAQDTLTEAEKTAAYLKDHSATEIRTILESVERYPDVASLTKHLTSIEAKIQKAVVRQDQTEFVGIGVETPRTSLDVGGDLTVRENRWTGEPVPAGYGNGAHIWTSKSVNCPDGTFVGGIHVHYRGSCNEQCNADGGIIGEIELICQPL